MPEKEIDGWKIYYEGVGNGPHPVLLLPGFLGVIKSDFSKIFPALNKTKFRWICWDPPGYGRSYPPHREHDDGLYPRCADLAAKLMETLGYKRFSVVGWSQGGSFAVILANNYPERVISLAIWGTFAYCTKKLQTFHQVCAKLELWSPEKLDEKLLYFEEDNLRYECEGMVKLVKRAMQNGGRYFGETVPSLNCPCLIIHGKKDNIVDDDQPLKLKEAFTNSRIVYFPEGGHDLHLVYTSKFVQIVEEFLTQQTV
ncbi:unnamed protein product [Allacma fusca]|uniref:AB hydrolase-1 domain-containing protein n=1 Tax=Allacma fusca TaxID=39272 RepID=A0A8J2K9U6_9HEXA|nr:unnamed protein product [Allacma fusca]